MLPLLLVLGGYLAIWSGLTGKGVVTTVQGIFSGTSTVNTLLTPGSQIPSSGGSSSSSGPTSTSTAGSYGGSDGSGNSVTELQSYAKQQLNANGWGNQWNAFNSLVMGESGWRWNATNPSSGAYGIPQSLPASKMSSAGADWKTNGETQIRWMMSYIKERYGSPNAAWAAWQARSPHWY